MNKKLFLKLGLGVLIAMSSLSFIACAQKDTSVEAIDSSAANINTQNSVVENEKVASSSENIEQKSESKTEEAKQKTANTQQKTEAKIESTEQKPVNSEQQEQDKQHAQLKTVQEKENFYYNIMNDAMQKQINYINSIEDPQVRQLVQSSIGAAFAESTGLMLRYPEDSEIINTSLKKVTQGTA